MCLEKVDIAEVELKVAYCDRLHTPHTRGLTFLLSSLLRGFHSARTNTEPTETTDTYTYMQIGYVHTMYNI